MKVELLTKNDYKEVNKVENEIEKLKQKLNTLKQNKEYYLILNKHEALMLLTICGRIGGTTKFRDFMSDIYEKLHSKFDEKDIKAYFDDYKNSNITKNPIYLLT